MCSRSLTMPDFARVHLSYKEEPMEDSYQATDFDQQTTNRHLQVLKAAIPYMPVSQQKTMSFLIKFQELQNAMHLFQSDGDELGICSLTEEEKNPLDMLESIKSYCSDKEKEMLDILSNFLQASQLYRQYQNASRQNTDNPDNPLNSMETLLHLLSPEQQEAFTQYQNLLQHPQQT